MKHKRQTLNSTIRFLTASVLVAAGAQLARAQTNTPAVAAATPPAPAPAPGSLNSFFNGKLPDAIGKSKITVNSRLRWEHADQSNLDESDAFTIRTRIGLTTANLYGFQAMIEGENVSIIGNEDNYNAAGSNPGGAGKTVIADPDTTELNQAWLSYTYTNWLALKGGRQRIVLDNHRFIGDVGWRQNMQTFDALTLESKPLPGLSAFYGYVWDVNRVFGDVSGLPAANRDFDSDSHLFNVSYGGWKYGKFTAYAYLLDLQNPAGLAQSCATYGGSIVGSVPVHEKVKLEYRGEVAFQNDYADSPLSYNTEYYNLELGVNVKPVIIGGGYELLGSDNGVGFRTPLATLHAFNGWADVFLATPAAGLQDWYLFAQANLPYDFMLRGVYHKFDADTGSADFGQEFDAIISKKLGKHWTALAKYAHYSGEDAPYAFDVDKFWLELTFNF